MVPTATVEPIDFDFAVPAAGEQREGPVADLQQDFAWFINRFGHQPYRY